MESPNINERLIQPKTQASPFEDLRKRAIDVSKQFHDKWKTKTAHPACSLFSRKNAISIPSKPTPRAPFVLADESKLVGMDGPRDELINHLVGGEENSPAQPQIKVASIVGMAGMGKSTLARLVYEAIADKFEARAFVSVNPGGDMKEVLASILQQLGAVLPSRTSTEKHLINTISKFLKEKRYMVIIDDIWHGGEWETIRRSLPRNNMGSRIVTTTRIDALSEKWRDDFDTLIYKMDIGWLDYYKRMIYRIGDKDVAAGMVDKLDMVEEGFDCDHPLLYMCGGMPLALHCMFSALAKEREHQEQRGLYLKTSDIQDMIETKVKRNGIQNTPGFEPLVESLQLDYINLPHHMLKTCFLYCCIYPEYRKIKKDRLVQSWIAERFVYKEETAEGYFDELVNRRLILWLPEWKAYEVGAEYKIHPMMQYFLRWKLREDDFITCSSDIPASYACRIRSLYIDDGPAEREDFMSDVYDGSVEREDPLSEINDFLVEREADPLSEINWSHIRSLVIFRGANRVRSGQLERLRVLVVLLDVQSDEDLSSENNDEGLSSENNNEGSFPEKNNDVDPQNALLKAMCGLSRVRHLLGFRGKEISEIPPEIGGLQHLETLEVVQTSIRKLPCEIGNLLNLKNLDLKLNKDLNQVPTEMGDLQHLENLCLSGTKIIELPGEIIRRLRQLKSLDVSGNYRITELPSEVWNLQHLRTLNLRGTKITELPREVGNLQELETLDLACTGIRRLPRDIGKLQLLEVLHLWDLMVKIPREIEGLQKLKTLVTNGMNALPWEACQLPKLTGLPECVREVWKKSDVVSSLAGEILSLHKAVDGDDEGLSVGAKHMHIPRWIKDHFNDLAFLDIRICKLEEEDLKILREMPCLKHLYLKFEVVPRNPVAISGEGFAKLYKLGIDSRVPRVTFQEGAMPRLIWLMFTFQFYAGPPNKGAVGINNLGSLYEVSISCNELWYRGDNKCISATIDVLRKEAREHPNIVFFTVQNNKEFFPKNKSGDALEESNHASSSGTGEIEEEGRSRTAEIEEESSNWTGEIEEEISSGAGEMDEGSSQA
ncbi:hypothetical protein ACQJBY_062143 [Aegilops geniculata]